MFQTAFENIAILVICMIIGFAARRGGILSQKDTPILSSVLVNITLPALMIMSMQREFDFYIFRNSIFVMVAAVILHMTIFALAILITKALKSDGGEKSVFIFSLVFPNMGFMGIPVIYAIYGADAMFYTAMINAVFNIVLLTLGIFIMMGGSRKGISLKSIFLNKLILATFTGFFLFAFSIKLPEVLGRSFNMIAGITTPLAMIIIGSILAENNLKTAFKGLKIYIIVLFRLIIFPLAVFFVLRLIIIDRAALVALTMLSAMPVAAIAAIFAAQYEKEPGLASRLVFISTTLSLFTIPLMVTIIESF